MEPARSAWTSNGSVVSATDIYVVSFDVFCENRIVVAIPANCLLAEVIPKMCSKQLFLFPILIFVVACLCVQAQSNNKTFTSGAISFEYPSTWRAYEKTSKPVQQVNIVPDQGNALIMISVYGDKINDEWEFEALKEQVVKTRVGKIASGFASFTEAGECMQFRNKKIPGQMIKGMYGQEPTTNSSFSLVIDKKFIHLLYLRENRIGAVTDEGWKTIVGSLRIKGGDPKGAIMYDTDSDESSKGKAIKLPFPPLTAAPKFLREIPVRVEIDEAGNVISATAPRIIDVDYTDAAITAAKKAKFLPTIICGEKTKVFTTITYVFHSADN